MALNEIGNISTGTFSLEDFKKAEKTKETPDFGSVLKKSIEEVNRLQLEADKEAENFALGKTDNIHKVMLTAEKADIALQFTIQIRNKVIDAYNEIMRMQI